MKKVCSKLDHSMDDNCGFSLITGKTCHVLEKPTMQICQTSNRFSAVKIRAEVQLKVINMHSGGRSHIVGAKSYPKADGEAWRSATVGDQVPTARANNIMFAH